MVKPLGTFNGVIRMALEGQVLVVPWFLVRGKINTFHCTYNALLRRRGNVVNLYREPPYTVRTM